MGLKTSDFPHMDVREFDEVEVGERFKLLADPNDVFNDPASSGALTGEYFTKVSENKAQGDDSVTLYEFDPDAICRVL